MRYELDSKENTYKTELGSDWQHQSNQICNFCKRKGADCPGQMHKNNLNKYCPHFLDRRYTEEKQRMLGLKEFISYQLTEAAQSFRIKSHLKKHNEGSLQELSKLFPARYISTENGKVLVKGYEFLDEYNEKTDYYLVYEYLHEKIKAKNNDIAKVLNKNLIPTNKLLERMIIYNMIYFSKTTYEYTYKHVSLWSNNK